MPRTYGYKNGVEAKAYLKQAVDIVSSSSAVRRANGVVGRSDGLACRRIRDGVCGGSIGLVHFACSTMNGVGMSIVSRTLKAVILYHMYF